MTATPVRIRPASAEDLPACAAIWKAGLDGYGMALGRPALAPASRPILDLLEHLHSTDGDRFLVAEGGGGGPPGAPHGAPPVAFVSAIRRSQVWFLSMLFVRPDAQARGLGRRLLQAVLPAASEGATLATCTDAAQPVSNGLYAGLGMVPRVPVLELVGRPDPARLPPLPAGVRAEPIEVAGGAAPAAVLDGLDREILGYAHPEDHAWLTAGGRLGFLYRAAAGEVLGYGYASTVGRMGPIAVRDEALLPGVLGHLLGAVSPAGAFAAWVPGAAGAAVTTLLRAGLRLEDFPALVCWDRPFADFSRYVPTSLAVL